MGRSIPADEANLLIHPLLSFSLIAAAMAATIAMLTALCSFRRKHPRTDESDPSESPASKRKEMPVGALNAEVEATRTRPQEFEKEDKEDRSEQFSKELPLPPGMRTSGLLGAETFNTSNVDTNTAIQMKKSASERLLLSNLSLKLPRSLSMSKNRSLSMAKNPDKVKEVHNKQIRPTKLTAKQEDTIWMKTIILGERCKVPPDDDELPAIYDAKGRRIPTYHPRSRQSSFIDPSVIPDQIRSRQCSFIDPSAIPDQRSERTSISNSVEIDKNKSDRDRQRDQDEAELMSLSQI